MQEDKHHRRTNRAAGFTLLEVLVALSLLGLILVALTNGVRFAGQAWQAQERNATRRSDTDAVQTILRGLVTSGTHFTGTAGELHFVAEMPEALARAGLYDIDLRSDGGHLMLSWQPHFKGGGETNSASAEMGRDIEGLNLAYFYGDSKSWESVTRENSVPPDLIRVIFRASRLAPLPPILIAPRIERVVAVTK